MIYSIEGRIFRRKVSDMGNTHYTAEELRNMTLEESEQILRNMKPISYSLERLKMFDVGIYDEKGHLIGDKEGDEY